MSNDSNPILEYEMEPIQWADGWAVIADPVRFASRFNLTVPGAYRRVTGDDVRLMAQCGLIGRCAFFNRFDLETVRGILQYEQLRDRAIIRKVEHELAQAIQK